MIRLLLLYVGACVVLMAAEPEQLSKAHEAIQNDQAAEALRLLGEARDPDDKAKIPQENWVFYAHAAALRGQAYLLQTKDTAAEQAFSEALIWDESFSAAAEGLIVSLQRLNKWEKLRDTAAAWAQQPDNRPSILLSACLAAQELDDPLLLLRFSENGLIRFPNVMQFRQLHAQALQATGQHQLALHSWGHLALRDPFNPTWWQGKAATHQRLGHMNQSRQQLAIAHALNPNDPRNTEAYVVALLVAEHADEAVDVARSWIETTQVAVTPDFLLLGAQAAYHAQNYTLGQQWLDAVVDEQRGQEWHQWSLYLASKQADNQRARNAIEGLIALGNTDLRLRFHAAHLAIEMNDPITGESHLRYLLNSQDAKSVQLARLHLARLFLNTQRLHEAGNLLRAAQLTAPEDPTVLGLLHLHKRALIDAAQD